MTPIRWTRGDTLPLDLIPRGADGAQVDLTGCVAELRLNLHGTAHLLPGETHPDRLRFWLRDADMPQTATGIFDADLRLSWPNAPARSYARFPIQIDKAPA